MTLVLASVLVSGCASVTANSYCDIVLPMHFRTQATVDWLLRNDRELLVDIVVNNETHERLCQPRLMR
jgi:hypothetical protein